MLDLVKLSMPLIVISNCHHIKGEDMSFDYQKLHHLRKLSVRCCYKLKVDGFDNIINATGGYLNELNIVKCGKIESDFKEMYTGNPKLQHLKCLNRKQLLLRQ